MKKIGFDGRSIIEVLRFTDGLKIFRFLEYWGGHGDVPAELGFIASFQNEETKDKAVNEIAELWSDLASDRKEYDWSTRNISGKPFGVHFQFTRYPGRFEESDFEFAKQFERVLIPVIERYKASVYDQETFPLRGFVRSKYL